MPFILQKLKRTLFYFQSFPISMNQSHTVRSGFINRFLVLPALELVLAALGACLTLGVTYVTALRGITIQSMDFTIEGELDIRGFFGMKGIHPGYEHIGVMVHLQADAKREELETLLTTVIETSPVRDIIARNVPVNIQLAKEE
jgi:uncharacterized OsmC-like protein